MYLVHPSIADIQEGDLITVVLSDPHYRSTLLSIKRLDSTNAEIRTDVQLRHFKRDLSGDIDILVIPREAPDNATAIQVKRFMAKASGTDAHTGHPSRMKKLFNKGIQQANALARLGFYQVYLWVFAVIDTREQNGGRYTYDGPDAGLRSCIDQAISPAGLHPRVGLMRCEWVQPMDRPPFELATHGGSLVRLAASAPQPDELTEWVRALTKQDS